MGNGLWGKLSLQYVFATICVCYNTPMGNVLWGIKWSHDRLRLVTPKGQTRDPNTLRTQYLENSWRCYLASIANCWIGQVCCVAVVAVLSAQCRVGYPSDSLPSCLNSIPIVLNKFISCCGVLQLMRRFTSAHIKAWAYVTSASGEPPDVTN